MGTLHKLNVGKMIDPLAAGKELDIFWEVSRIFFCLKMTFWSVLINNFA